MANISRNLSEKSDARTATGVNEITFFWSNYSNVLVNKRRELACYWLSSGAELNSSTRAVTWVVKPDDLDEGDYSEHSLCVTQAVLGPGAVSKEQNIIALESMNANGELKRGVVANLIKGSSVMAHLDFVISGKIGVRFTLAEGSGTVFLSGNHFIEHRKDDGSSDLSQSGSEWTDAEEEEQEVEEDEHKTVNAKSSVRPLKTKKAERDVVEDDVYDDEDEVCEDVDESEDDKNCEFEEDRFKKMKNEKSRLLTKSLGGMVKGMHDLTTDDKNSELVKNKKPKKKKSKKGNFFSKSLGTIVKGIQDFSTEIDLGGMAQWRNDSSEDSNDF